MNPVIKVDNVSKSYNISHQQKSNYHTFKDDFVGFLKKPVGGGSAHEDHETFWALKNLSFEVNKGEIFGIVGKNGSGKSTLLKILSRIVDPTEGSIEMHGRVASLLEVGTGFHPELTGRENVYFNGSMLGMSRQEVKRKFEAIVEFSEVEKFLDTPVKFYSSGMYVRLAFAVAANLDPDILILDEVLSVGDAGFQKKSMNKIMSIASEGKTILFVSHSMGAVNQLCERVMFLQKGKMIAIGDTEKVTDEYIDSDMSPSEREALLVAKKDAEVAASPPPGVVFTGKSVKVQAAKHVFRDFKINNKPIEHKIVVSSGKKIVIDVSYENDGMPRDLLLGYAIKGVSSGDFPIYVHNKLENASYTTKKHGQIRAELIVPKLAAGDYTLEVNIWLDNKVFVENEKICTFKILEVPSFASKQLLSSFPSSIMIDSKWDFSQDK